MNVFVLWYCNMEHPQTTSIIKLMGSLFGRYVHVSSHLRWNLLCFSHAAQIQSRKHIAFDQLQYRYHHWAFSCFPNGNTQPKASAIMGFYRDHVLCTILSYTTKNITREREREAIGEIMDLFNLKINTEKDTSNI